LLFDLHLDQTQLKSGENIARKIGIETLRLGIDQPGEFRLAFQRAAEATVDAMLVHSSPVFVDQAAAIAELALEFRMPTIGLFPIYAKVGGLFSYGPHCAGRCNESRRMNANATAAPISSPIPPTK
jgi:putative tryptophan/tyrosine transport system substrate-binding protein